MSDYSTLIAQFEAPGGPSGFGDPGVEVRDWQIRCREIAKKEFSNLEIPIAEPIRIICRFKTWKKARPHDLDNLIKSLIDSIGAAGLFPKSKSGGAKSEWNTDDIWVFSIIADKELVDENPKTYVEIWK